MRTLFCNKENSMLNLHVEIGLITLPSEIHGKNVHVYASHQKLKLFFFKSIIAAWKDFFLNDVYQND